MHTQKAHCRLKVGQHLCVNFFVSQPKFTNFLQKPTGIAVDQVRFRFSISWLVPEIFRPHCQVIYRPTSWPVVRLRDTSGPQHVVHRRRLCLYHVHQQLRTQTSLDGVAFLFSSDANGFCQFTDCGYVIVDALWLPLNTLPQFTSVAPT